MMSCRRYALAAAVILAHFQASGCALPPDNGRTAAPALLPHVSVGMRVSGFWTARLADPDAVVLAPDKIRLFNERTRDALGLTHDVTAIGPVFPVAVLRSTLAGNLASLRAKKLFRDDGRAAGEEFYRAFRDSAMPPQAIAPGSSVDVAYGITTGFADQRMLPTDEGLYAKPGDGEFDELRQSGLDIGTPLGILLATDDGEWLYVQGPLSAGWVKAAGVATCSRDELGRYLAARTAPECAVVIAPLAEIFRDPDATLIYGRARMGAAFPMDGTPAGDLARITVPSRMADGSVAWADGFVRRDDIHRGYLPYTARTVIDQAFKLLGAPYGWGDRRGARDCSRFIQEVFATVGIEMPRDSKDQGKVGVAVAAMREEDAGTAILKLDGHIMLFVGMDGGRPYAIHALYGYREPTWRGDRVRVVNRVTLSDLSLGEGSSKGSLLERLTTMRKVTLP